MPPATARTVPCPCLWASRLCTVAPQARHGARCRYPAGLLSAHRDRKSLPRPPSWASASELPTTYTTNCLPFGLPIPTYVPCAFAAVKAPQLGSYDGPSSVRRRLPGLCGTLFDLRRPQCHGQAIPQTGAGFPGFLAFVATRAYFLNCSVESTTAV